MQECDCVSIVRKCKVLFHHVQMYVPQEETAKIIKQKRTQNSRSGYFSHLQDMRL